MSLQILFIDHSFHVKTKSSQFFIEFLNTLGNVSLEFEDCWNGKPIERNYEAMSRSFDIVVVWQLEEVIKQFKKSKHKNIIFVPMYDSICQINKEFWDDLRNTKVVCYSAKLAAMCNSRNLDHYHIQYYPKHFQPSLAGYSTKKLYFWQRRSFPNWRTVNEILPGCQFDMVHLHSALDPEVVVKPGTSPTISEMGQEKFRGSKWYEDKEAFLAEFKEFNLFFVPREREGIGFSFLDAMELGLIPIGFNYSTFNEYIVDGLNGFIVDTNQRIDLPNIEIIADKLKYYIKKGRQVYEQKLSKLGNFVLKPVKKPIQYTDWLNRNFPKTMRERRSKMPTEITASRQCFQGEKPVITVITVVRNDVPGLTKTIQSVCSQLDYEFEYIIVDGASASPTIETIEKFKHLVDNYISEPDQGPYHAMMKGAKLANGKYIVFMNAGDEFAESTSLVDAMTMVPDNVDIIYGHHYYISKTNNTTLSLARDLDLTYQTLLRGNLTNLWKSGIPCHQSCIVSKELILKIKFDRKLRIAADHALLYDACALGAKTHHSNTIISKYYGGGLSAKMQSVCIQDWKRIALKHTSKPKLVSDFYEKMGG